MDNTFVFRIPWGHFLLQFKNFLLPEKKKPKTLTTFVPNIPHFAISWGLKGFLLGSVEEPVQGSLLGKQR